MTKPKSRTVVIAAGLVLLAVAALALYVPRKTVALEFAGTPGLKVEGTCTADGQTTTLSGTLPFEATYQAKRLEFAVRAVGEGALAVTMTVAGQPYRASSSGPGPGARGEMRVGPVGGFFGTGSVGIGVAGSEP